MLFPQCSIVSRTATLICLLAALLLSGCGYTTTNSQPSLFGNGTSTMHIREVKNATIYPWLNQSLRTAMYDEITNRHIAVMSGSSSADYAMVLDIKKFSIRSRVLGTKDETLSYTVSLTFVADVYDNATKELVWTSNDATISRAYSTNDERTTGDEITALLAQKLADKMRNTF
ncbi:MAG: LPS assembly lipoprotein LptE [Desulfovibrionales bacterium]|nr:LPS assembly lipoprotein LptE [Desulfovibrionales bacterium]